MAQALSKDFLINEFWRFYEIYGRYPKLKDFNLTEGFPSERGYLKHWRGYSNFLKDIGVVDKNSSDGWYIRDEKILKDKYLNCDKDEIINSLMVKRSWSTIKKKANSLGIYKVNKLEYDENEFIRDYNDGMSLDEMYVKYGYKNKTALFPIIKKLKLKPRLNRWSSEQISILKDKYPYEEWETLLDLLKPFKKEDIITKAYKLKIKRDCYGYSEEEVALLKDNYGKVTFNEIKELLPNKSESSIMVKANKLGLVMREKWSEEDIEKLKILYPKYSNRDLLEHFPNRTETSLQSMAGKILGIYKSDEYWNRYKDKTKNLLLEKLKKFAEELGRTPTSDEINDNPDMGGLMSYHRYFGSYSQACEEAGLDVNVSIFGKSYHYISSNGDLCLSSKELEITNLLIKNGIVYEKETLYRDIINNEDLSLIRCDWYIDNEIVVEYFGMAEKKKYKKRMEEKIELCEVNGIKLIQLYPKDIRKNFKGLIEKFNDFGIIITV